MPQPAICRVGLRVMEREPRMAATYVLLFDASYH